MKSVPFILACIAGGFAVYCIVKPENKVLLAVAVLFVAVAVAVSRAV